MTPNIESRLEMWCVEAVNLDTKKIRKKVVSEWKTAMQLARRAMDLNWKVKITPYYTDVLISTIDGELYVAALRVTPRAAAKISIIWAKKDNRSGCVLWPHGRELPEGWKIYDD